MTVDSSEKQFQPFAEKMQHENLPGIAIANFRNHYHQLLEGQTGNIPESAIYPVDTLPDADALGEPELDAGEKALPETVLLKLNGGLGTSMGLERAKSLITIKQQYSFLDIIIEHAIHSKVQLLLMNSFSTRDDTRQVLQAHPQLQDGGLPLDFLQHKVPKIRQQDLAPVINPADPQLEWCPPGHGDIYLALQSSGMLDRLLGSNFRYALISNSDNLGATLDSRLLGYLVLNRVPFLMEVTDRTEADSKGGHLARDADGRLLLRESAQCRAEDRLNFEDIQRHRYFNTNNLWIDLQRLQDILLSRNSLLELPLIRNSKTMDPRDRASAAVYQLETAMGSAISIFDDARAIRVPRSRFVPVKTSNDLLLVRSDVYALTDNYTLHGRLAYSELPDIRLDGKYYALIDDFEARFPHGVPSLMSCRKLRITGDVRFGANITVAGEIELQNNSAGPVFIPDNTRIEKSQGWT